MLTNLIKKDLLSEFRGRELIILQTVITLLLVSATSFGIQSAFLSHETINRLFPIFLWLIFIFSATVSVVRSFDYEVHLSALDGLLVSGVSPVKIYLSKVIVNWLILSLGLVISEIILSLFLNITINSWLNLFAISILVAIGYSSLSTLLSGITTSSKLRGMLLPLILIPLLFPLLFAAVELTLNIILNIDILAQPVWLFVLLAFDIIYFALGLALFEEVIRE